jgi:hypothetical protein
MLKHKFDCPLPDDPEDAAAGRILPSHWDDDHAISGGLDFPVETVSNPAADILRVHGVKVCEQIKAAYRVNAGEESALLQPSLARGRVAIVSAAINSQNLTAIFIGGGTVAGAATAINASPVTKYLSINRVEFLQTVAGATNIASWRYAATYLSRAAVTGGFYAALRGGVATGASNSSSRFYVGARNATSAPTDSDPSTQINHVGVGWDSADANVQIMHNDGSGVSTKIDLGVAWPVPVTDRSEIYQLEIYSPRGGSSLFVTVTELVSGRTTSRTITADLPAAAMSPVMYTSVGGVSDVTGLVFGLFYSEIFD